MFGCGVLDGRPGCAPVKLRSSLQPFPRELVSPPFPLMWILGQSSRPQSHDIRFEHPLLLGIQAHLFPAPFTNANSYAGRHRRHSLMPSRSSRRPCAPPGQYHHPPAGSRIFRPLRCRELLIPPLSRPMPLMETARIGAASPAPLHCDHRSLLLWYPSPQQISLFTRYSVRASHRNRDLSRARKQPAAFTLFEAAFLSLLARLCWALVQLWCGYDLRFTTRHQPSPPTSELRLHPSSCHIAVQ